LHCKNTSSSARVLPSSHTNYRFLTEEEKKERLNLVHQRARVAEKKVKKLQKRLKELCEKQGKSLDTQTDMDIRDIMQANKAMICEQYPIGSFARIFWEQQLEASSKSDARQMRWHPAMIRFVAEIACSELLYFLLL
jgi:prolyl oligopeptidase PreP (S9A serine peptidase family)